jgi:hypothetical protein
MIEAAGCSRRSARLLAARADRTDKGVHMIAMSPVGWFLWSMLAIIVWVVIAFWPARVAARKGHSFLGFFVLSLFFFPLALILAYVVKDRHIPYAALA